MEAEIETEAHPGAATPSHLSQARQEDQETIAWVAGESVKQLPTDLYIPPEALEVFLDTFEGPLDLLLYLIRRQNLNIWMSKWHYRPVHGIHRIDAGLRAGTGRRVSADGGDVGRN